MPQTKMLPGLARGLTRRVALVALTALTAGAVVPGAARADGPIWTMVTDQHGLGDHGFNDLAKLGIDRSVKAFGGRAQVIQSADQSQYVPNLLQAVAGGSTMIVAVGTLLRDAVTEVAEERPNAHFTLIDAVAKGPDGKPLPNVASVTFHEQEGSYLAGIVAAMTTKTRKIAFIGGMEVPPVVRFYTGFSAGIHSVDPKIKVSLAYVGSFSDPAKAKVLAQGMLNNGDDVIMDVTGGGGVGVFDAVKAAGAGKWVISADMCKENLAPKNYLTSAVKDVAGAVFYEDKAIHDGTFKGGVQSLGLKEGAVGLCADTLGDLPKPVLARVDAAKAAIISGKIVVPATMKELTAFLAR